MLTQSTYGNTTAIANATDACIVNLIGSLGSQLVSKAGSAYELPCNISKNPRLVMTVQICHRYFALQLMTYRLVKATILSQKPDLWSPLRAPPQENALHNFIALVKASTFGPHKSCQHT